MKMHGIVCINIKIYLSVSSRRLHCPPHLDGSHPQHLVLTKLLKIPKSTGWISHHSTITLWGFHEFEFQKFFLQNYETVQNSINSVIINHTPLEKIQFYNKVKFETNSINVKQFEILQNLEEEIGKKEQRTDLYIYLFIRIEKCIDHIKKTKRDKEIVWVEKNILEK